MWTLIRSVLQDIILGYLTDLLEVVCLISLSQFVDRFEQGFVPGGASNGEGLCVDREHDITWFKDKGEGLGSDPTGNLHLKTELYQARGSDIAADADHTVLPDLFLRDGFFARIVHEKVLLKGDIVVGHVLDDLPDIAFEGVTGVVLLTLSHHSDEGEQKGDDGFLFHIRLG